MFCRVSSKSGEDDGDAEFALEEKRTRDLELVGAGSCLFVLPVYL